MNAAKKLSFLIIGFFCFESNAEILYKTVDEASKDFNEIPAQSLYAKSDSGDHKYKFLLAHHKLRDKNQKEQGVHMLEELAEADVVDAKHSLYLIYDWANVNFLTKEKTVDYLKEAAEEGYTASQVELAKLYYKDYFGKNKSEMTHYWLLKAAEQGDTDGMIFTAEDYYVGRGVAKNEKKGFDWLMKYYSVLGRDFTRWNMLGDAYENGSGTPVDLARAYMCYDLDGTAGIEEKARIAPRMTPEQRAEGLRLSREWQAKNHVYTMQSLGLTRQKDGSYQ